MLRAAFIMAALDAGVRAGTSKLLPATPTHALDDLRPAAELDRHAAYVVVAFVAGG